MAFEIVTVVVGVIAIALALTGYFRTSRAVDELGRQGEIWFEHSDDREVSQRPSEDAVDEPLPRRPLRAKPR